MIDPRDFGKLEAQVESLKAQVDDISDKLDKLVELATEGRGGIRALWFAGSIVGTIAALLGVERFFKP